MTGDATSPKTKPRERQKEVHMNAIKEERIAEVTEAAFELHPNVGTWAIAYHKRIAFILERFEDAGVRIGPRIIVLARVLANTGVDPEQATAAWEMSDGEDDSLETAIYARIEAWNSEDYQEWAWWHNSHHSIQSRRGN